MLYGDGLYRWNRTTGNNQYIIATGLFQQIKGWEIDFGYKHLQTLSGSDIIYPVDPATNDGFNIIYPRDPRENYDAIEFGFSYTTSKTPLALRLPFDFRSGRQQHRCQALGRRFN